MQELGETAKDKSMTRDKRSLVSRLRHRFFAKIEPQQSLDESNPAELRIYDLGYSGDIGNERYGLYSQKIDETSSSNTWQDFVNITKGNYGRAALFADGTLVWPDPKELYPAPKNVKSKLFMIHSDFQHIPEFKDKKISFFLSIYRNSKNDNVLDIDIISTNSAEDVHISDVVGYLSRSISTKTQVNLDILYAGKPWFKGNLRDFIEKESK